jgi:hypothetical protein
MQCKVAHFGQIKRIKTMTLKQMERFAFFFSDLQQKTRDHHSANYPLFITADADIKMI